MEITLNYFSQIRQLAGTGTETVEVNEGATVAEVLATLQYGDKFKELLLDEGSAIRSTIMPVVNGQSANGEQVLNDGDEVSLFAPIAGG
ncbi:hypothetical protein BVX97_05545 [bacterium E08(2017)]|nr:hypothetical protein BVX97_05545 [bacterium E08(2017)]